MDSVEASCAQGRLTIQITASTNSGGWSQPSLRRVSVEAGSATYEVVGFGPAGPAVSMMLQIAAFKHQDNDAHGIKSVRILAESNEKTVPAHGCTEGP